MIRTSTCRALVAAAIAATLVPGVPASAQVATPTPTVSPAPVIDGLSVSRSLIDLGQTVDATVTGAPGTQVALLLGNFRASQGRQIRTGTIGSDGSLTWTDLRPQDSVALFVRVAGSDTGGTFADVLVRRTVTLGVAQRGRGTFAFSGRIVRPEAGVPVVIARLRRPDQARHRGRRDQDDRGRPVHGLDLPAAGPRRLLRHRAGPRAGWRPVAAACTGCSSAPRRRR